MSLVLERVAGSPDGDARPVARETRRTLLPLRVRLGGLALAARGTSPKSHAESSRTAPRSPRDWLTVTLSRGGCPRVPGLPSETPACCDRATWALGWGTGPSGVSGQLFESAVSCGSDRGRSAPDLQIEKGGGGDPGRRSVVGARIVLLQLHLQLLVLQLA